MNATTPIQLQTRFADVGTGLQGLRRELGGLEGAAAPVAPGWEPRFAAVAADLDAARQGLLELMPQHGDLASELARDAQALVATGAHLEALHGKGEQHTWGIARSLATPTSNVRRAVHLLEHRTGVPAYPVPAAGGPGDHTGADGWGDHAGLEPGDHS